MCQRFLIPFVLALLAAPLRGDQDTPSAKPVTEAAEKNTNASPALFHDEMDKVSYSFGMTVGSGLKPVPDLRTNAFLAGIFDVLYDKKTLLTETQRDEILKHFDELMQLRHNSELSAKADKNKTDGEAFLAENAKKEGIKTLPSGLQYKIINPGSGPSPKMEDTVTIHYRGTLINGQEFDSSYARKIPAAVPLRQVIKGWTEALQLMSVGAKWQLSIPSDLGYAANNSIREIPANSTLIYEMELLSIAATTPTAQASKKNNIP